MKTDDIKGQRIPVTDPEHLIDIGITIGLLSALKTLDDVPNTEKLTGFNVARHALKASEAEHRVLVMQKNIRLAVKAGIDLDTHRIVWCGNPEVIAEPHDETP